jgi:dipeptidyl aminopeptidase/acylaminoacyl peptidase
LIATVDGTNEQRLTSTKRIDVPTSWSPDGKLIAVTSVGESGNLELRMVAVEGDHTPQILVQGAFNAGGARFSPDGHWLAYVSDESGRNEVYVRPFPEAGPRIAISASGGTQPAWSRDGRELFFRNGDQLLAVSISYSPRFVAGKPEVLFSRTIAQDAAYDLMADYDVSTDGKRFVFPKYNPAPETGPRVRIILNWFAALRRLTSTGK